MKALGVVAEYNPFHNGHAHHIAQAKRLHGGAVVVVLSGDFVQRGEIALYDKYSRTRLALENGADLVLQLPTVYSLSSAQRFARGAVDILSGSGIVDTLSFGSECGSLSTLEQACLGLNDEDYHARLRTELQSGVSYPKAAALAGGSDLNFGPNDILALEYLRAIRDSKSPLCALCVPRKGALHDGDETSACFASAAYIRQVVLEERVDAAAPFVPEGVYQSLSSLTPRKTEALSSVILYALRRMQTEELAQLPDVGEGLENVLYRQARACTDYTEFLFACKTKRYTLARLKRISMNALLGVSKNDLSLAPYIRVLGVRRDAKHLLSQLCQSSVLPVVIDYADWTSLPSQTRRMAEIDLFASETACMAAGVAAVFDYRRHLLLV